MLVDQLVRSLLCFVVVQDLLNTTLVVSSMHLDDLEDSWKMMELF